MKWSLPVLCASLGFSLVIGCQGNADNGSGDGDENDGPAQCGDETCSDRQVCDDAVREPVCECAPQYEGDDCQSCAEGYEENGDTCQRVIVDCDDNPCGINGACVSESGESDHCECNDNRTGPTCAQCVDEYQDNDGDGECELGCDSPDLDLECTGLFVCDDSSGTAQCVCPVGSAGDDCELCEDGYAREGNGDCYEICSSGDFDCDEPTYCFDDGGKQPASCLCPMGSTGEGCNECAPGFEKAGDSCVNSDSTSFDLLTLGVIQGRSAVVGIDSSSGETFPLFAIDGSPEGLVYDDEDEQLYVANYQGVFSAPWGSGEITQIIDTQIGHGKPLSFASGQLYSLTSSDYNLFSVDPDDGTTTDLGTTATSWVWDMTYRLQDGMLYVLRSQGQSPTIHSLDPSDATTVELGQVAGAASIGAEAAGGLAALTSGDLAVLTRQSMTQEEAYVDACGKAAERLGYEGYHGAPSTLDLGENAPNTILSSNQSSGPELVIYRSYGGSGDNVVSVQIDNPDAFVCIFSYEENFEIAIDAEAVWVGGVAYTYESTLSTTVPDGFTSSSPILVGGGSNAMLTSLDAYPEAFQVLSAQEMSDRRLPPLSDFTSYTRTEAPYVLRVLSLPGLEEQSAVAIEGAFRGGLTKY